MSEILQQVKELPYEGLIPVGLLFVCGMLLWGAGQRVMRIGFPAAGFLIGGITGWSFGARFDLGVAPWIAGTSSAVVLAIAVSLAYRLAVAVAVAMLIATLAPMAVWTADERNLLSWLDPALASPAVEQPALATPGPDVEAAAGQPIDGTVPPGGEPATPGTIGDLLPGLVEAAPDGTSLPIEDFGISESDAAALESAIASDTDDSDVEQALRRPFEILAERFRDGWDNAAPGLRGLFVAAVFIGGMIGFVVGGLAPGFSATVVSALGGSFLLLTTGSVLAARTGFSAEAGFMQSATFWTLMWLILAVIGLGIQSIFRPRSADKPAD